MPPEFVEAGDEYGLIEGTAKSAANEGRRSLVGRIDGAFHLRHFGDRDSTAGCIRQADLRSGQASSRHCSRMSKSAVMPVTGLEARLR